AGGAAGERPVLAVGQVVVDPRVELRLRAALVAVAGILRRRDLAHVGAVARNLTGRTREGILRVAAGRDLEREPVVHRLRVRAADVKERAGALADAVAGVAIEAADAEHGGRSLHFAR